MTPDGQTVSGPALVVGLLLVGALAIAGLEHGLSEAGRELAETGALSDKWRGILPTLRAYARARGHVAQHWYVSIPLALIVPALLLRGLRWFARSSSALRERAAGMELEHDGYALKHPYAKAPEGVVAASRAALSRAMLENPAPEIQVAVGFDEVGAPIYLTDEQRTMHVHLLGQTGSGKTQSVIYPLLFQDIRRDRAVVFLDAKGSIDNEEMLMRLAGVAGRSAELKMFTFNKKVNGHTYNPLHLVGDTDPRAVAERVFSTFADEMDNPYYRNTALEFFVDLVEALAATGKRIAFRDCIACLNDTEILDYALAQSSDSHAAREVKATITQAGDKFHQTFSGLRVALKRFAHPALNSYDPDIILEELLAGRGVFAFSLSANSHKFLARAVGMLVLQHLQQIGAMRQQDRSHCQDGVYVYADEFYSFAYEGFIDAVNKLRDANMSMLLSHQSQSDLERVSPEYAQGIWDNTRTKIVLAQTNPELCSQLAESMGTTKGQELTVRRNADAWLNQQSMLEASTKLVDSFVLHPSQIKALDSRGQAYLIQAGLPGTNPDHGVRGVNVAMLGALPDGGLVAPKEPDTSLGLNLWDLQ